MLTGLSRLIGAVISIVLMALGTKVVIEKLRVWKKGHDDHKQCSVK